MAIVSKNHLQLMSVRDIILFELICNWERLQMFHVAISNLCLKLIYSDEFWFVPELILQ